MASELPREVRAELRALSEHNADAIARRLVMATRLIEEDPEQAYQHALTAQRMGGRIGAVREATGLSAYAAGHYAEALAELRAARRLTGSDAYLPVMADCERGLGRPERALALAASAEVGRLDRAGQVEMRIVAAGARRDLGQDDAAVVTLQGPDLSSRTTAPWAARLRYAYADALLAVGRRDEAQTWFQRAAEVDAGGETDVGDRLAELEGLVFIDLDEGRDEPDAAHAEPGAVGNAGPATDAGPASDRKPAAAAEPAADGEHVAGQVPRAVFAATVDPPAAPNAPAEAPAEAPADPHQPPGPDSEGDDGGRRPASPS